MKLQYLFILLLSSLLACESVSQDVGSAPRSLSHLSQRLAEHVESPVEAGRLESWMIAEVPEGYEIQEVKASSVIIEGIPLTEGRMVCTNENGYVTFLVTDYVQDSLSYLQVYRRYLEEAPAEIPASLTWTVDYNGFGWMWTEPGTDIHYLEAGILDRFHLRIRSNQPSAASLLAKLGKEKNWKGVFLSVPHN